MKELYLNLRNRILTLVLDANNIPYIKTCRLWNNQVARRDDESDEDPFLTPAVFIEFVELNWNEIGKGVSVSDAMVRFHLVVENVEVEDLTFFDIRLVLHQIIANTRPLVNVNPELNDPGFIPPNRIRETFDINNNATTVFQMDYVVNKLMDLSLYNYGLVQTGAPIDLDLTVSLSLAPGDIRTNN